MSLLKQLLPTWMKAWRRPGATLLYRSANVNIYHCTVQKSASQWLRGILADPRTFRYCGLSAMQGERQTSGGRDRQTISDRSHLGAFPEGAIVTPLYTDFAGFTALPKPPRYKAFFVMRDPRDVLVSWYFSLKHSHPALGDVVRVRHDLQRLSEQDGLLYALDFLDAYGLFAAQRSWAGASAKDANVLLTRFEELVAAENIDVVQKLLLHCDILMPTEVLTKLLQSYRFEELSGRRPGQEDRSAHYRKGIAGDWRNHFNDRIEARFMEVAGDVIKLWHYPSEPEA